MPGARRRAQTGMGGCERKGRDSLATSQKIDLGEGHRTATDKRWLRLRGADLSGKPRGAGKHPSCSLPSQITPPPLRWGTAQRSSRARSRHFRRVERPLLPPPSLGHFWLRGCDGRRVECDGRHGRPARPRHRGCAPALPPPLPVPPWWPPGGIFHVLRRVCRAFLSFPGPAVARNACLSHLSNKLTRFWFGPI
jgi:hypothetical protein